MSNISPECRPIPTVSDPEPSDLDRRFVAVVIGICLLIAVPLAVHFGPAIFSFLAALAS